MNRIIRTLAALASAWLVSGAASGAPQLLDDLAPAVQAFREERVGDLDGAIAELRELIAERAEAIEAIEEDLQRARQELVVLEALREVDRAASRGERSSGASDSLPIAPRLPGAFGTIQDGRRPAAFPGTLDDVRLATAVSGRTYWTGTIAVTSGEDGRLRMVHRLNDAPGNTHIASYEADRLVIRIGSAEEAQLLARCLEADGKPVVSLPGDVGPHSLPAAGSGLGPDGDADRIRALEAAVERLTSAVGRIEQRLSPAPMPPRLEPVTPTSTPTPLTTTVQPPAEIPPAPAVPD
ncbi:hypothetical protein [Tautonia sociabilis]|uniref:Uncharacterized protein n=1 Tax=Tautonia sociabilis TaxID=2080755 RepID=A0A432MIC4_9BACT|nr:hypothetical protein [Tautonia sociabilis]RUL86955.1 hypothetical protein TsocGM_15045 [Tautonia sociabilis]